MLATCLSPDRRRGRFASEPLGGATALTDAAANMNHDRNASVTLATDIGDTVKRIDGTEVPLVAPWGKANVADEDPVAAARDDMMAPDGPDGHQGGKVAGDAPANRTRGDASDGMANVRGSEATAKGKPDEGSVAPEPETDATADSITNARTGEARKDAPAGAPEDESPARAPDDARPAGMDAPRGTADQLTRIKGDRAEAGKAMQFHGGSGTSIRSRHGPMPRLAGSTRTLKASRDA